MHIRNWGFPGLREAGSTCLICGMDATTLPGEKLRRIWQKVRGRGRGVNGNPGGYLDESRQDGTTLDCLVVWFGAGLTGVFVLVLIGIFANRQIEAFYATFVSNHELPLCF